MVPSGASAGDAGTKMSLLARGRGWGAGVLTGILPEKTGGEPPCVRRVSVPTGLPSGAEVSSFAAGESHLSQPLGDFGWLFSLPNLWPPQKAPVTSGLQSPWAL